MSGHWPPEWDDPEEEFTEGAEDNTPVVDETAEARLSEVTAYLAAVPVPAMPEAVETRINAAIAAEAATRAEHPAPADGARNLGPAPARARVRRGGAERRKGDGDGHRRRFRVRPQVLGGSLLTCLVLAAIGFGLSHLGFSSSSASGPSAGTAAGVENSSAASSAGGANVPEARPTDLGPRSASSSAVSFTVTASGTRYQRATLAEQVRDRLAATASGSGNTPAPSAAAVPSAALRGCVAKVTGGAAPKLVDRATYRGEPAYVIASSDRVWVVGTGCTAAKTDLIVSVALAGLPGNLRALVSVEQ